MISVCLTTYNGEKYVVKQLRSILSQLESDDEVIISDDDSSDRTLELIKNIEDKRVKIFKNNKKRGIHSNVENALNQAKGDIIFLADQDDFWMPDKVQVVVNALENNDLVVTDCYITDKDLNIVHESFFQQNNSQTNKWRALIRNPYLGCCMAFKRNVLESSLPFPSNIPMHDIWIGNVAAFRHQVSFIPNKLIFYRRHGNNVSSASEPSKYGILQQINFRIKVIQELIKLSFKNKQN
jgi:glycosyltransferase involved in cell wall biosynthesis